MRIKADFASETVPAGRQWRNICKDLKEKKMVHLEFCTREDVFQNHRQNKDIFRHRRAEGIVAYTQG